MCAAPPALRLGRKSSRAITLAVFLDLRGAARSVVCPPVATPVSASLACIGRRPVYDGPPVQHTWWCGSPRPQPFAKPGRRRALTTAGCTTCCLSPSPCGGTQTYISHRARMWTTRAQSRVSGAGDAGVMPNSGSKSGLSAFSSGGVRGEARPDGCPPCIADLPRRGGRLAFSPLPSAGRVPASLDPCYPVRVPASSLLARS